MRVWPFLAALVVVFMVPAIGMAQDAYYCIASGAIDQCADGVCLPVDAKGEATGFNERVAKNLALESCFNHMTQLVADADSVTMSKSCHVSACETRTASATP